MLFISVIVLAALIKLLLASGNAFLCAGIYAAVRFAFASLLGIPLSDVMTVSGIAFGLALVYFWLLNQFRETAIFWLVMIPGLVIGLV